MRVDRVLLRDLSAALAVVTAAIASPVANPVAGTATLASISEEPIPGRIVNQFKYEGEPDFSKQIFKYANGTDVEVDMTTPDVLTYNGVMAKPFAPGGGISFTITDKPPPGWDDSDSASDSNSNSNSSLLEGRDPDYHCSGYAWCQDVWVTVPRNRWLWSFTTIRQNQGASNNGVSGMNFDEINVVYDNFGGCIYCYTDIGNGCRFHVKTRNCHFTNYGLIGSYNYFHP